MGKNKIVILILSAVFMVVFVCALLMNGYHEKQSPFSVIVSCEKEVREIKCYNKENEFYLFVPSYAELSKMKFKLKTDNEVKIDDSVISNDMLLEEFEYNKSYTLEYSSFWKTNKQKFIIVSSENVATVYIDTESGNMDYIHENKENKESGKISIYTSVEGIDYSGDLTSIKGRGNNTWDEFEKKPYNIELQNESNLLGMGKASQWVLLANADDHSNLRNKLVYDFSDEIGLEFSPDSRWVDLYLNGEYAGLYLLSERNEVHENRVNIDKTDGALLSIEQSERLIEKNDPYIYTDSGMFFRIHYPSITDETVTNRLTLLFQNIENKLLSESSNDSELWSEYIDLDSFAKRFLVDEIFGNLDGFYASSYFYTIDNKIYAGPVWDYDKAMGNDNDKLWSVTDPNIFMLRRYRKSTYYNNKWIEALYHNKEFKNRLLELLTKEYSLKIEQLLAEKLSDYAEQIAKAAEINALRWMDTPWDFQSEIKQISDYIRNHTDYINKALISKEDYYSVTIVGIGNDLFYSAPYGGKIPKDILPTSLENKKIMGWYRTDNKEPFDTNQYIIEDVEIYPVLEESLSEKAKDIIKIIPIFIISFMFIVFLVIEFRRIRNGGGGIWQKKIK